MDSMVLSRIQGAALHIFYWDFPEPPHDTLSNTGTYITTKYFKLYIPSYRTLFQSQSKPGLPALSNKQDKAVLLSRTIRPPNLKEIYHVFCFQEVVQDARCKTCSLLCLHCCTRPLGFFSVCFSLFRVQDIQNLCHFLFIRINYILASIW